MTLPGTTITERDSVPTRTPPTQTGTAFIAGFAEQGPTTATLVRSLRQFVSTFGARVAHATTYDAVEAFFREGGARAYISRVVGPAPVKASVILDAGSTDTVQISAKHYGTWQNGLRVAVTAGDAVGEFKLVITHSDDAAISETSPSFATVAAAAAADWSSYVVVSDDTDSALDPDVIAAQPLAGGTDDYASATDASWETALGQFAADLGPGQVLAPGRTTVQAHTDLLEHAQAANRFALLDLADTDDVGTLTAAAASVRALATAKHGQLFAPWAVIPGVVSGTTRTIPYSAIQAGLYARLARSGLDEGEAAAGLTKGRSVFATALSQEWPDDGDRETLNDAGITIAKADPAAGVVTYGNVTPASPSTAPLDREASARRLVMAITAKAGEIAGRYVFAQLDGRGRLLGEFAGELAGMLLEYYRADALFGETPNDAFLVDVGDAVNTPETLAAGELHATLALRVSPAAEMVVVEIARTAITETL